VSPTRELAVRIFQVGILLYFLCTIKFISNICSPDAPDRGGEAHVSIGGVRDRGQKIRFHGSSTNTRIVFNDDGAERPSLLSVGNALAASREEYLATVGARREAQEE